MTRALASGCLLLLAAPACGPGGGAAPLDFELYVSAALADRISSLQVAFVKPQPADCAAVQSTCLVTQVPTNNLVDLTDDRGVAHKAVVFPLDLKAGSPQTQDVKVVGIPPGKDYAVVIEALSKADPPTLVGSSCNYVKEIVVGVNPSKVVATISAPSTPPSSFNCDPRIEK